MKRLRKAAVGGTFDELHRGHKTLIGKAFEIADRVVIGLSSDVFVAKMGKPHLTASYAERKEELENYLDTSGLDARYEIVPLDDTLGRTMASAEGLEALVVSKETKHTAQAINVKRKKAAMLPLKIFTVDMVPADNKSPISTTRIRSGEIDRNGHVLKSIV
jgi:pantetheine-phosphate adenylyltransferase